MSNIEDNKKDGVTVWAIRDFPEDVKNAAMKMAKKEKVNASDWVSRAIREKIKNDRSAGTAIVATKDKAPVDIMSAGKILDMLERLHGMNISIPESLQKQALTLIRACLNDVKQGKINVNQQPKQIKQDAPEAESD